MKLHVRRIELGGETMWALFFEGELSRPVAIVSDLNMKRLLREVQEQSKDATA